MLFLKIIFDYSPQNFSWAFPIKNIVPLHTLYKFYSCELPGTHTGCGTRIDRRSRDLRNEFSKSASLLEKSDDGLVSNRGEGESALWYYQHNTCVVRKS